MKAMYLQYDFILNMLQFHTGRFQYEIKCIFSMISYCCNSILGGFSMNFSHLHYDFVLNML